MENIGKANFFAFVSHKSADREFALKTKKFIENYQLPESVRQNTNWPKRLSPICCYEDDFSSNPLLTEMEEKLRQSQFLIVICSKDTEPGGSKYVNFEIETFIKQKQEEGIDPLERIIPIIVSGAFDSETEECCPAALKALGENRPIAADRRKYKSDREVFLHAISGMLDIDYSVMVNRDKKKRRTIAAIVGAICLAVTLIGGGILFYMVPKDWHYVDFVMQNGLPVGIERLTQSQYEKMNAHYVITTQRGKITQLKYVNSKGTLIKHDLHYRSDRPAKYVFDYDSTGLTSVTYYNELEQPYFVMNYYNKDLSGVDLRVSGGGNGVYFINSNYERNPSELLNGAGYMSVTINPGMDPHKGMISRLSYTYNENGFVTKVLFHADSSNKRVADNGVFGFEYELDDLGRIRKVYYLDIALTRCSNSDKIYCTEYIYDQNNNLAGLKYYAEDGTLKANKDGIIQLRWTYDQNHNRTMLEVLDAEGKPMMDNSEFLAATIKYRTDNEGNMYSTLQLDENGKVDCRAGDFRAFEYDQKGLLTKTTILDINGNPVLFPELGFAAMISESENNGRSSILRLVDLEGNPVNSIDGYAYKRTNYNEAGALTSIAYYDAAGKLVNHNLYGYSIETREYDSHGRMTALYYLDKDQKPVNTKWPSTNYGYHKITFVYEDLQNGFFKMTQSYYGQDGNLVNYKSDNDTISAAEFQIITQNGYMTFLVCYDKDHQQVGDRCESNRIYNVQGELEETIKYFQPDGTMVSMNLYVYDGKGVIKRQYFEKYNEEGSKKEEMLFHENGNPKSSTFSEHDKDGNPVNESKYQYDINGNETSCTTIYHDDPDFYHWEEKYEYNGTVKSHSTTQVWNKDEMITMQIACKYDSQGRELASAGKHYQNGTLRNSYTKQYIYQADGSYSTDHTLFDADGKQVSKTITHYDSEGNRIKE